MISKPLRKRRDKYQVALENLLTALTHLTKASDTIYDMSPTLLELQDEPRLGIKSKLFNRHRKTLGKSSKELKILMHSVCHDLVVLRTMLMEG